jgi:hypothetical protein
VISYKIFNIWGGIFVSFNARYWDARGVENTVRCTRGFIKDAVNGAGKQRIVKDPVLVQMPVSGPADGNVFH